MNKSCLVVDDSKVIRKFVRGMMTQLCFDVDEAENGRDGLGCLETKKYDLILLDWNMPIMNGLEFIKEFKNNYANLNTKVIFCTTENEMEKIKSALDAGANEYIMKPFDIEVLRSKLTQCGIIE